MVAGDKETGLLIKRSLGAESMHNVSANKDRQGIKKWWYTNLVAGKVPLKVDNNCHMFVSECS